MSMAEKRTREGMAILLGVTFIGVVGFLALNSVASDHEHSPLAHQMEEINDQYKTLRRQARKGAFDDTTLPMVVAMQKAALTAMHEAVPYVSKQPKSEQLKMTIAYKKQMASLVTKLLDLEIALLEGRKEDAMKIANEGLAQSKKQGHETFKIDE